MLILRNEQIRIFEDHAEGEFLAKAVGHVQQYFPDVCATMDLSTVETQTVAAAAVAQFHGFTKQNDIVSCVDCLVPALAHASQYTVTDDGAGPHLRTLLDHTQQVLAALPADTPQAPRHAEELLALKHQANALAPLVGGAPINIDRSGAHVPFTEHSPVKVADLTQAALAAAPQPSQAPNARSGSGSNTRGLQPGPGTGATSQEQLAAALSSARQQFRDEPPRTSVQRCKKPVDVEFRRVYWDGTPIPRLPYTVTLSDGSTRTGFTDLSGLASHSDVPPGDVSVVYGEDPNPPQVLITMDVDEDFQHLFRL